MDDNDYIFITFSMVHEGKVTTKELKILKDDFTTSYSKTRFAENYSRYKIVPLLDIMLRKIGDLPPL